MTGPARPDAPVGRVVGVLPDLTGLDRVFHYLVPQSLVGDVRIGTVVRVHLQGRRVRAWVVELDAVVERALLEIDEVASLGPDEEVLELARFGSWRYAGRLRALLVAATPPRRYHALADAVERPVLARPEGSIADTTRGALGDGCRILRLPPAAARLEVVEAVLAACSGTILVLVPERRDAEILTGRLARVGQPGALWPEAWDEAAAGGRVVVGTRTAVLARVSDLSCIVVLDAHAEAYVSQRAPTWDATVLAKQRARQSGVPCLLVSAVPSLTMLAMGGLTTCDRATERAGWPALEILDRRGDDPRSGLYSERLAPLIDQALRDDPRRPVVCLLNRTGRARLLACGACGTLAACEHCGAALRQSERPLAGEAGVLSCPQCHASRPLVCASCGSTRLKLLRIGVQHAAEELAGLLGEPVDELAATSRPDPAAPATSRVIVGTEAALHRVRRASLVVFLDFDQELLAARLRAGEQALALLARAARLVGGRGGGRIAVQTRIADHEVLGAAVHADPGLLNAAERPRRAALRLPPFSALALVTGEQTAAFGDAIAAVGRSDESRPIEIVRLDEQRILLRASDADALADALRAAGAPHHGVRIEVDPLRV